MPTNGPVPTWSALNRHAPSLPRDAKRPAAADGSANAESTRPDEALGVQPRLAADELEHLFGPGPALPANRRIRAKSSPTKQIGDERPRPVLVRHHPAALAWSTISAPRGPRATSNRPASRTRSPARTSRAATAPAAGSRRSWPTGRWPKGRRARRRRRRFEHSRRIGLPGCKR